MINPPKWLKSAISLAEWCKAEKTDAYFRRMRRYAVQGRILTPDGSVGAWQAFEGVPWVVHPLATTNEPYNGGPRKRPKRGWGKIVKKSLDRGGHRRYYLNMRTKQINPDFRKTPKTETYCAICQKDLKVVAGRIFIINEGFTVVHPSDAVGIQSSNVGPECAKKIGKKWIAPK